MARTHFVAGNWKMNTLRQSAVALAGEVAHALPAGVHVGIAPPFVYLDAVSQAIRGSRLLLGAQDVYFEAHGAFTGEISVEMLRDLGVHFCLSGHSERRHVLNEPPTLIARKAAAIYAGGLTLVHCVGETLAERNASQTLAVVQSQLEELDSAKMADPKRLVIAYEPVWAIGTGLNATDDQAQEVHAFIRDVIRSRWNAEYAYEVRIQYGGSLKPENAQALMARNDVDGGLVGGASLKAESFLEIVRAAASAGPASV
jgi:triosephosphate isomerase (TIM)